MRGHNSVLTDPGPSDVDSGRPDLCAFSPPLHYPGSDVGKNGISCRITEVKNLGLDQLSYGGNLLRSGKHLPPACGWCMALTGAYPVVPFDPGPQESWNGKMQCNYTSHLIDHVIYPRVMSRR